MNRAIVENAHAVIEGLKKNDGFHFITAYFKEKQREIIEELLKNSGGISNEELLQANAKMDVYRDLENFDILVKNDLI